MTTTVIIHAHCSNDIEVEVGVRNADMTLAEHTVIQDGESHTVHVYDDRVAEIKEVKKHGNSSFDV